MTVTGARRRTPEDRSGDLEQLTETTTRLQAAIEGVVSGKPEVVRSAVTVLLAGGHLLIEDVPGVGKTILSKALARAIDGTVRRIQFTPDLLPSDVTGVSIYNQETRQFEFRPGGVFGNIIVGDEINRASPKTQSALLECMEERQVTVDGRTYGLEDPFMVVATQNPIEMEGTYPLPEAQRDRFMARVSMGYPPIEAELAMLEGHGSGDPLAAMAPVCTAADVAAMSATVRDLFVSPAIRRYAVDIVTATRRSPEVRLGASPRATLQLMRAAKATAALDQREYVLPDDLQRLAVTVLSHRLLLTPETSMRGRTSEQVVASIVGSVPVPDDGRAPTGR
ncbi:MAG: MoxR family ATPase [Nocardioidaceae bacterium]|nr:MoxR family ATPase [Nocardioidaceae bacterium]